ncbi:MAG: hypothetical protein WA474_18680 [Candidatus Sulfotelmatobacter sp.]
MKFHDKLEVRNYEQRLKENRNERVAEAKQIERLISALVKKAASRESNGLAERVA